MGFSGLHGNLASLVGSVGTGCFLPRHRRVSVVLISQVHTHRCKRILTLRSSQYRLRKASYCTRDLSSFNSTD